MGISRQLADTWSATDFGNIELDVYAEKLLRRDTRIGLQIMAMLALAMQLAVALLTVYQELDSTYLTSSTIFAALSLHVLVSARFLNDVRALQLLGMTFLIIGALTIAFLAHRTGDLNIGMMAAVVGLFVSITIVPWALREAATVVAATYLLMTSSLISVPGRFEVSSLIVLQLLILGTAVAVVVVTARNTLIRKHDIQARFDLERAHDSMERLSMQDALTGAWNRRFLIEEFDRLAARCHDEGRTLTVAVLDIDDFKGINDEFGHDVGDQVLAGLANLLILNLGERGHLIRLGGDEFQIIYCGSDLEALIDEAVRELQHSPVAAVLSGRRAITLSAGIVGAEPGSTANQEALYKAADQALYSEKSKQSEAGSTASSLARTGTWRL